MTELKTLKDIFQDDYMYSSVKKREELRAEARKHFHQITNQEVCAFIYKFFNLTDEDLK